MHPLVDGLLKGTAREVHLLADFRKDNGHAGILADRQPQLARGAHVFTQVAENGTAESVFLTL